MRKRQITKVNLTGLDPKVRVLKGLRIPLLCTTKTHTDYHCGPKSSGTSYSSKSSDSLTTFGSFLVKVKKKKKGCLTVQFSPG